MCRSLTLHIINNNYNTVQYHVGSNFLGHTQTETIE